MVNYLKKSTPIYYEVEINKLLKEARDNGLIVGVDLDGIFIRNNVNETVRVK